MTVDLLIDVLQTCRAIRASDVIKRPPDAIRAYSLDAYFGDCAFARLQDPVAWSCIARSFSTEPLRMRNVMQEYAKWFHDQELPKP